MTKQLESIENDLKSKIESTVQSIVEQTDRVELVGGRVEELSQQQGELEKAQTALLSKLS